jgi:GT2 family glycosyltransferase
LDFNRGTCVVVPTWNNLPYLKLFYRSFRQFSTFDNQLILHINDGSDGTLEWAKENKIQFTWTSKNIGVCAAINLAVRELCDRDIVSYFNDDMYLLPGWDRYLQAHLNAYVFDRPVWLSTTMIEPTGSNPCVVPGKYGTSLGDFREMDLIRDLPALMDWAVENRSIAGTTWAPCHLSVDTWEKIGGMSEEYEPPCRGSDPDLARKVFDLGCRNFIGVPRSLVYHFQTKVLNRLPPNDGNRTFLRKHGISIQTFVNVIMDRGRPFIAPEKNVETV